VGAIVSREKISLSVLVRDEYGNEHTVVPEGWMWVLAFAIRGVPWAVEEIESGRCDAAQKYLAAVRDQGAFI
jgi:hypothetical protein